MTTGSIARHLLSFALPLLIGNVFQQMYNTVDSIIVGKYVSKEALAAIGCSTPVINTFINFFSGLATGAGIVISNYFGAKDEKRLSDSVHTTVTLVLILCVVITVLGVTCTPLLLRMMNTPDDVFYEAKEYLRIYFWGVSGLLLYNIGSGIKRAVGDSMLPLYVLIFCTVMNIALDLLFIRVFNLGVSGAATATVISQALSAAVIFALLLTAKGSYRVRIKKLRIHRSCLASILRLGLPTALQMAITAFSNVFVQSYVNGFGSSYMAGWTAYTKIDNFAMQPITSLSSALTTYTGQNVGAGETERARKAPRYGLAIGFIIFAVMAPLLMLFAPQLVKLFNEEAEVVAAGTYFIRVITPCYVFFVINQAYIGPIRGMGKTVAGMTITLFSFVAARQAYLYVVNRLNLGLFAVSLGYPVGWAICAALLLVYYYGFSRRRDPRLAK